MASVWSVLSAMNASAGVSKYFVLKRSCSQRAESGAPTRSRVTAGNTLATVMPLLTRRARSQRRAGESGRWRVSGYFVDQEEASECRGIHQTQAAEHVSSV